MKKKCSARIPGLLLGAVLLGCNIVPAPLAGPVTVLAADEAINDGDILFDLTFEDGGIDSFMTYLEGGDAALSNKDGMLDVAIGKCGKVDYANQVYYDGFALTQGAEYTWSFDVSCDIERQIQPRIQLNGGDYHAYIMDEIIIGPEVLHYSVDFTMNEATDPAPRMAFNMGYQNMDSDPGAHHVYLDNIRLTVKSAADAAAAETEEASLNLNINQVGYLPEDLKTVFAESETLTSFTVCRADTGESVFDGTFSEGADDAASASFVKQGDFSALTEEGTYYIKTEAGDSAPFTIASDVYTDVSRSVVQMLYLQRCGTDLDDEISGVFDHPKCHMQEAIIYGTDEKIDVSGGWHDAGDYGRYVVPGAKTIADLFAAYEDYAVTADDFGIPESGNGVPDLLDEARWELEWMLKMQSPSGGVYHKVTGLSFPGFVMPEEETADLYVSPVSTAATGDFAAVMARASVLYQDFDPDFASKAADAAFQAWEYIKDVNDTTGFTNPSDITTGEYPDSLTADEKYWAAAELYLAGHEELEDTVKQLLDQSKQQHDLGWADIGIYADHDLAKSETPVSEAAADAVLEKAASVASVAKEDQYFMTLGTVYPWGSNMTVANHAEILLMASKTDASVSDEYTELAFRHLDYLLGANPMGYCYVSGFGTKSPVNPHHRPSQAAGEAMPGMLAGGPDSSLEDPHAQALLKDAPPAKCYIDNAESYSTNEVAIYWNSPLIYLMMAKTASVQK